MSKLIVVLIAVFVLLAPTFTFGSTAEIEEGTTPLIPLVTFTVFLVVLVGALFSVGLSVLWKYAHPAHGHANQPPSPGEVVQKTDVDSEEDDHERSIDELRVIVRGRTTLVTLADGGLLDVPEHFRLETKPGGGFTLLTPDWQQVVYTPPSDRSSTAT